MGGAVMTVIGITGPTGAGKTTALHALEQLGAIVLDADRVYHRLLAESPAMQTALVQAFGPDILDGDGAIDRKRLAGAVYPDRLEELNLIITAVMEEVEKARTEGYPAAAIDAIALVESGLADRCDVVVSVLAPMEERIRRIMVRDNIDEAYARRRALAQKGEDFFRSHSDYVLENTGEDSPEAFEEKALGLFREIVAKR
jgi:dephospho-CoA kinase